MKHAHRYLFLATCALSLALVATSCASAPKKGPSPIEELGEARDAANASRVKAVEIKAPVAAKASFETADTALEAAKALDTAGDIPMARDSYREVTKLFETAYQEAAKKRDAAQAALDNAGKERVASEEAIAKLADAESGKEDEEAVNE